MKIFAQVKVNKIHSYIGESYNPYDGYEKYYIYTMKGEDGNTYVWKTTKVMMIHNREMDCATREDNYINEGDEIDIVGSFKCDSEYKGQPQKVITRVEVQCRTFAAPSEEEIIESQMNSVGPKDKVLVVPYWKFKNEFSDCETVLNSYDPYNKCITIIVRDYDNYISK